MYTIRCTLLNKPLDYVCKACHAVKPISTSRRVRNNSGGMGHSNGNRSAYRPAVDAHTATSRGSNPRSEMRRTASNYHRRSDTKPGDAESAMTHDPTSDDSKTIRTSKDVVSIAPTINGQHSSQTQGASADASQSEVANWRCPSCGVENFKEFTACHSCQRRRLSVTRTTLESDGKSSRSSDPSAIANSGVDGARGLPNDFMTKPRERAAGRHFHLSLDDIKVQDNVQAILGLWR